MRKIYKSSLFLALLLLSFPSHAQHFDWVKSYSGMDNGNQNNYIVGSVTDHEGNLYIVGQFGVGADIDGTDVLPFSPYGPYPNNIGAVIAKLSPTGQLLWHKAIQGNNGHVCPIYGIRIIGDTSVIVMANFDLPRDPMEYLYFLDSLYTDSNVESLMPTDSVSGRDVLAILTFSLDGTLQESHFLQKAYINNLGAIETTGRAIPYTETLRAGSFQIDATGNFYLMNMASDAVAVFNGTSFSHYASIENDSLQGIVILDKGRTIASFFPENNPSYANFRILKFSPHFTNLLDYRYISQEQMPPVAIGSTDLAIDNNGNIYASIVLGVQNEAFNLVLDSASGQTVPIRDFYKGMVIKYSDNLDFAYVKHVNFSDTSFHRNYSNFHKICFDEDSNSLFMLASLCNYSQTVYHDSCDVTIDGSSIDITNKSACFLRFDKSTGEYLNYGKAASNNSSHCDSWKEYYGFLAHKNRIFAQVAFKSNIEAPYGEMTVGQTEFGHGIYQWDYEGNPISYLNYYLTNTQSGPGGTSLALHDSNLYIMGNFDGDIDFGSTRIYGTGNSQAIITRYVDTAFLTPYTPIDTTHTDPIDTGDVRITVVGDEGAFVAYPNPFRQSVKIRVESGALKVENGVATAYLTDLTGRREEVRLVPEGTASAHSSTQAITQSSNHTYTLDLTSRPQSTYLLTLTTSTGQTHTVRLLKQSDIFGQ